MSSKVSLYGRARFFFRKYIVHGRIRIFLQWLFAKCQALFIQPTILPYFVTFFPFKRTSYAYVLRKVPASERATDTTLPTPPENLWLGYGRTIEEWLESGKRHVTKMRNILAEGGQTLPAGSRVLELGCAGGRMLRFMEDVARQG